ncbi:hypothetical protein G7046_g1980 [Stylonectria norvegica]|nr:hypothetical protein G7046_g1980 [Stylonectria norvegica]
MEFQFIDGNAPKDRRSRKTIRSHVMKGKNLGKTIQKRGRKHATLQTGSFRDTQELVEARSNNECPQKSGSRNLVFPKISAADEDLEPSNFFTGFEFSYFAFPVQFTPSMRRLVYQFHSAISAVLYPNEFCRPARDVQNPWFEYMITDQAFLHCLLAMAATYISLFKELDEEPPEATQHFSQTLRLVNRDISQDRVPKDPTIAVVVSLAIHSNLSNDAKSSRIHLQGLQRMVALCPGGLTALRGRNSALVQKIYRTDIDYSIMHGTKTMFPSMSVPFVGANLRRLPDSLCQLCLPLRAIAQDLMALCRRPQRAKMEGLDYQDAIISICQRLVNYSPLGNTRPQNPQDDVWQLGLLSFIMTLIYSSKCLHRIYCRFFQPLFRARFQSDMFMLEASPRFWLLFVNGMTASDEHAQWALSRIREVAIELQIKTWGEAKEHLQVYPWIATIHETPGRHFWESIMSFPK